LPLWLGVICCFPATLLMLYAEKQYRFGVAATQDTAAAQGVATA
jgi:hypothetical protein